MERWKDSNFRSNELGSVAMNCHGHRMAGAEPRGQRLRETAEAKQPRRFV